MNVICLVIDRLHAGYLGCYGNSWVVAPELRRLAAESFVFDTAILDSPELDSLYRSWWRGRHAFEPIDESSEGASLPRILGQAGVRTALVTDDPAVRAALPRDVDALVDFQQVNAPLPTRPTADVRSAHLRHVFDAGLTWLETAREPFLLWLHIGSLGMTWDAPRELREQYAGEEESASAWGTEPPRLVLPPNYDPDALLAVTQAYAGQITVLDEHVGHFLDCFRDSPWASDTLVVLIGARGLPLGEHLRVGPFDEALHGELIQIPWMTRFPDGLGALCGAATPVQPADLPLTLLDWWGIEPGKERLSAVACSLMPLVRDEVDAVHDRACACNRWGERGIRTPRWFLRQGGPQPAPGDAPRADCDHAPRFLYAKPDDRCEVNEVSDRRGDVAEALVQALAEFQAACGQKSLESLPPLDELVQARHA